MADEKINLILDVKGGAAVKDLRENLAYTQTTLQQLKAAYEAGQVTVEKYLSEGQRLQRQEQELSQTLAAVEREQQRLNTELLKSLGVYDAVDAAMEDVASSSQRAAAGLNKVGDAATASKGKAAGLSQAALDFSRGVEDLSTGGFIGVLNNIPGMFSGIGRAAGLSSAGVASFTAGISLAATAAYVLYKNWDTVRGLFEERNPIPEATNALDRHEESLKKVNKSLDEMKEKTSLNFEETKKFKDLQKEQADLEEKLAQDRKNKANEASHNEHSNQADQEAASGFAKALDEAGGYKLVVERFTNQLATQLKATEKEIPGLREAIKKQFSDALAGDRKAIDTIKHTAATDKTGLTGIFDTFIDMHSPETKAAQKKAEQSQALIEEFESPELGDKALKAQNAAKEKAADKDQKERALIAEFEDPELGKKALEAQLQLKRESAQKHVGAQIEREDASIKGGGYDKFAEGLLAQTRAQGGATDQYGRFRKMNDAQITEYVRSQVERALRRKNRGMDPEIANNISTKVALNARADVEKKLTSMGAAQATNQQKLIMIAGQSQAELERLMSVVANQGQQIDQLRTRQKTRSRSPLKRGGH